VINSIGSGLGSAWIGDGGTPGGLTVIGDPDPLGDVCSTASTAVEMGGKNIGDLLSDRGITWGWFQGGFNLTLTNPAANGHPATTGCHRSSTSAVVTTPELDYVPHHEPFQYYASTRNLAHVRPTSVGMIGRTDVANHQYDVDDFFAAVDNGNMPAVSFLKPKKVENAHPGNSDPLDEQRFIVRVINFLQSKPEWDSTVVIIAYDDSDGWYDHQMGPIINQSETSQDFLSATGFCGTAGATTALPGIAATTAHAQGRCGYGPRLPFMVISPFAKRNFIDHTVTDQTSIIKFIEDTWLGGQRIGNGSFDERAHSIRNMLDFDDRDDHHGHRNDKLFLSETTGEPIR
jgi:phospholipase C